MRRQEPESRPHCHGLPLDESEYTYLLGAYPGDGHITTGAARSTTLWTYCADDRPGVSAEVARAMTAVRPDRSVHRAARTGCHALQSRSRHWLRQFPQHGQGLEHTREIVLHPWQQSIAERYPGRLVRGLIHSDGCRIIKGTVSGERRYEYPRYMFSDKSEDILAICESALDRLRIDHRRPRWDTVSVARRGRSPRPARGPEVLTSNCRLAHTVSFVVDVARAAVGSLT